MRLPIAAVLVPLPVSKRGTNGVCDVAHAGFWELIGSWKASYCDVTAFVKVVFNRRIRIDLVGRLGCTRETQPVGERANRDGFIAHHTAYYCVA